MARYFPHDYAARTDRKLARLLHKYGTSGIGIYWCIIEMLYENDGYLMLSDCDCIANELRTHSETVMEIISSELFEKDSEKFWSISALKRLDKINEKSQKAQESAFKRWGNAKAMPTQCEGNAIKQNKIKDIKKINKRKFGEYFNIFWKAYPKKRNKGDAEKAFKMVAPDEQLMEAILTAIERATKSAQWLKDNGQFIPYPATWLRAKGWEDEEDKSTGEEYIRPEHRPVELHC